MRRIVHSSGPRRHDAESGPRVGAASSRRRRAPRLQRALHRLPTAAGEGILPRGSSAAGLRLLRDVDFRRRAGAGVAAERARSHAEHLAGHSRTDHSRVGKLAR